MKKTPLSIAMLFCAFMLISLLSVARSPLKFNYQGVARDASGNALASQAIGLKI